MTNTQKPCIMDNMSEANRNKENALTHDYLISILSYDETSGEFWWKERAQGRRMNKPAGSVGHGGKYREIILHGIGRYLEHRLAWFYVHKKWPKELIDHIDGDGLNNRLSNLREATNSQNATNRHTHDLVGIRIRDYDKIRKRKGYQGLRTRTTGRKPYVVLFRNKFISAHETLEEARAVRQKVIDEYWDA